MIISNKNSTMTRCVKGALAKPSELHFTHWPKGGYWEKKIEDDLPP
jgi:hypothetical protein